MGPVAERRDDTAPGASADAADAAAAVAAGRPRQGAASARRSTLRRAAIPLFVLALLACDLARPPASQASARLLLGGIHLYQATLSPRMPALGVHCRFTPTCSHYAVGAIERHGALLGSLRAVWRICRCGPWTRLGTYDPPT